LFPAERKLACDEHGIRGGGALLGVHHTYKLQRDAAWRGGKWLRFGRSDFGQRCD